MNKKPSSTVIPGSCWGPVCSFFDGDVKKTADWFLADNPLLGNQSPVRMLEDGRHEKLLKFIETQLKENKE